MSLSKKHKSYKANGGQLGFNEWVVLYDRLASARAARGASAPKARKSVKALAVKSVQPKFERVNGRVDCFGVNKKGITTVAADLADAKRVAKVCNGTIVGTYTSKRGERARIATTDKTAVMERRLALAGFTPKGF